MMESKRKIVIIVASLAVVILLGINAVLFYIARNSSTASIINEVQTTPTPTTVTTPVITGTPEATTNAASLDQEANETLQDVDSVLNDLNSLSDIPTISQSEFQ